MEAQSYNISILSLYVFLKLIHAVESIIILIFLRMSSIPLCAQAILCLWMPLLMDT